MKKSCFKNVLSIVITSTLFSCAGAISSNGNIIFGEYPDRFLEENYKLADFKNGKPQGCDIRHDRGNGHPFNCTFSKENVVFENDAMDLHLTQMGVSYAGAEVRSKSYTGFGFYSVYMKVAKCPGVISSFFVYKGNPWHEIDIEFLGNDTTKVQFNHYTDAKGNHEYLYNLGFDASEDYHEYAFDWTKDYIIYYVDGKAVYKTETEIPYEKGRIMMNLWNVADSNQDWAGKFDDSQLPVTSSYKWFGYQSA